MTEQTVKAENGRSATICYSIILEDGSRVDAKKLKPLTFKVGAGKIMPALEEGILGMSPKEKRQIRISAEQGYGRYNEQLLLKVERKSFPDDLKLSPGRTVQYQNRDGERANFVIKAVDGESVILDGNHPLAGQNLIYEVELLSVQ
ncbi:MAG: peptidylprolyl isomerase [Desulfopila sp.]